MPIINHSLQATGGASVSRNDFYSRLGRYLPPACRQFCTVRIFAEDEKNPDLPRDSSKTRYIFWLEIGTRDILGFITTELLELYLIFVAVFWSFQEGLVFFHFVYLRKGGPLATQQLFCRRASSRKYLVVFCPDIRSHHTLLVGTCYALTRRNTPSHNRLAPGQQTGLPSPTMIIVRRSLRTPRHIHSFIHVCSGRLDTNFEDRNEDLIQNLIARHPLVGSFEMETFQLFHLARVCRKSKIHASAASIVVSVTEKQVEVVRRVVKTQNKKTLS